jgi:ligand-binding SRPBCC domain-containing protein
MLRVESTEVINRPIEEVWSYISDPRKTPEYSRSAREREILSAGPIGKGTRYRNVDRLLGRRFEYEAEVIEYDAPTRWVGRVVNGPVEAEWQETLEPSQEVLGSPASQRPRDSGGSSGSSRTLSS